MPSTRTLNVSETGLRDRLMSLYLTPAVFPEVPEVLCRLRAMELVCP